MGGRYGNPQRNQPASVADDSDEQTRFKQARADATGQRRPGFRRRSRRLPGRPTGQGPKSRHRRLTTPKRESYAEAQRRREWNLIPPSLCASATLLREIRLSAAITKIAPDSNASVAPIPLTPQSPEDISMIHGNPEVSPHPTFTRRLLH